MPNPQNRSATINSGAPVPPLTAPNTQTVLQQILDREVAAVRSRYPKLKNLNWTITIDQNSDVNAFVRIQDSLRSQHAPSRNHIDQVHINSGLIQLMLGNATNETEFQEGLEMIAGVIAHEIGHSIDYSQRVRANADSQLAEVFADGEAVPLLRDARLPTNSLYRALRYMRQRARTGSDAVQNSIKAYFSTHPSSDFRDIHGEVGITLNRFQQGSLEGIPLEANRTNIQAEVRTFPDPVPRSPAITLPESTSIPETIRFLRSTMAKINRASEVETSGLSARSAQEVVYDHLYYRLQEQIEAAGDSVSARDARMIMNFAPKSRTVSYFDEAGLRVTIREHSVPWPHLRSHIDISSTAKFFRSDRFRKYLRQKLEPAFRILASNAEINWQDFSEFSAILENFCAPDVFAELVQEQTTKLLENSRQSGAELGAFLGRLQSRIPAKEFDIPLARIYQNVLGGLSEGQRSEFLFSFDSKARDGVKMDKIQSFQFRLSNASGILGNAHPDFLLHSYQTDALLWAKQHGHWDAVRSIASSMWKDAGLYAAYDLLRETEYDVDWHLIFESVGISDDEGRRLLNERLRDFLRSPRYVDLLQRHQVDIQARADRNQDKSPASRRRAKAHPAAVRRHFWLDANLWNEVIGQHNPSLTPEVQTIANRSAGPLFLRSHHKAFREIYSQQLAIKLAHAMEINRGEITTNQALEIFRQLPQELGVTDLPRLYDLQINALRALNLPTESEQRLLSELYLGNGTTPGSWPLGSKTETQDWTTIGSENYNVRIYEMLRQAGVAPPPREFLSRTRDRQIDTGETEASNHFRLLHDFAGLLSTELEGIQDAGALVHFAQDLFFHALDFTPEPADTATSEILSLSAKILAKARQLDLTSDQARDLFRSLTQNGTSLETDLYFEEVLTPLHYSSPDSHATIEDLRDFISQRTPIASDMHHSGVNRYSRRRIGNGNLRAKIARIVLDYELNSIHTLARSPDYIHDTLERLLVRTKEMTEPGTARDKLIESLPWSLEINDPELLREIESHKSSNWHFVNTTQIQQASAFTEMTRALQGNEIQDAIQYFMKPEGHLPDSLIIAVKESILRQEGYRGDDIRSLIDHVGSSSAFQVKSTKAIREIETAAHSSGTFERVPVLMQLMRAGDNALQGADDYPKNILRRFLNTVPESVEERAFLAYLDSAPPEEISFTLAYRMAVQNDRSGLRWRPLFEVFSGVGIKAGQMAGLFRLFGPEATAELQGLENNAEALSLHQITEIFSRLPEHERARIRRPLRVLGSASMKTVVLVELTDGRQVVAMVQRPFAKEQIRENLRRARNLVTNLRQAGIAVPRFMDQIIDGTEKQMKDELRMTVEAENVRKMQNVYRELNHSMRHDLAGWRFEVPGLVEGFTPQDHILFMEFAPGTPLKGVKDGKAKSHAARVLTQASMRGMLRHGVLNPDPHGGNYIIDEDNRTIRPIDFGQLETYRIVPLQNFLSRTLHGDDAYNLSQFLHALQRKDANAIVRFGDRIRASTSPITLESSLAIKAEIRSLLHSRPNPNDLLIGITDIFSRYESNLAHRFSFGALKGLLIHYENPYLEHADFSAVLSREVEWVLRDRASLTAVDSAIGMTQNLSDCLINGLTSQLSN